MGYNKRQFQKANDKKVLHKVRKHWVVISMALLMAIGGKAAASHVSAHADTTNNNANLTNRISNNISQSKSTLTSAKANSNNNANQAKANRANVSASANNISKQANVLHQRILQNANQQKATAPKLDTAKLANNQTTVGREDQQKATVAPNNMVGIPDPSNDPSNYDSKLTILWVNESDGMPIDQELQEPATGTPLKGKVLTGKETDFKSDSTYEFDPTAPNTNATDGGLIYDRNADYDIPSTFQGGEHELEIMVKKRPVIHCDINVQYVDQDSDDNGAVINQKADSDDNGAPFLDLQADQSDVPFGFYYDGNIISHDGIDDLSNITFTPGTKTIKLGVKLKNNGLPTENVVYQDVGNHNTPVGATTMTGKQDNPLDAKEMHRVNSLTPSGYDFVSDAPGDNTNFEKGTTYYVDVKSNGVQPTPPTPENGYGTATIEYINEANNQTVFTRSLQGKSTDQFNLQMGEPATVGALAPAGWDVDSSKYFMGDTIQSGNYGSNPVSKIYVTAHPNYSANNATANIVYEDENNNNTPIDTEQVTGKAGSQIDYSKYINFLPADSIYEGLGSHSTTLQNGDNNVILVKKINTANPGNITVHYIDQSNGSDVSDPTINGNTLNYGSNINVTSYKDKDGNQKNTLPTGYKVINGQNVNARVNDAAQNVDVLVQGDPAQPVNKTLTIVPVKVAAGTGTKTNQASQNVNISGVRGSKQSINLSSYAPAHYIAAPSDSNSIYIDKNGNLSNPGIHEDGKLYLDYDQVAPVMVNYVNVNDNNPATKVVGRESINANEGQTVDVTKDANQSDAENGGLPAGYSDVQGQQTTYKVGNEPLTVNYLVQGKMVNVSYKVGRNTNNAALSEANGHLDDYAVNTQLRVGDKVVVTPTTKGIQPDALAYGPDPSNDTKDTSVVTYAGGDNGSIQEKAHDYMGQPTLATYTYDANGIVNNVTPIEIQYVNQAGDVVAHHEVKTHKIDPASTYQLGDIIKNVTNSEDGGYSMPEDVAADYQLANPDADYSYSFNTSSDGVASDGNKAQIARVNVVGRTLNNVSYKVDAYKIKDGQLDGNDDNPHETDASNKTYRIGDHININPASYNPNGSNFAPTYSDAGAYLTVDSDGETTPNAEGANKGDALKLNYNVKQSYITVNYKDLDNGNQTIPNTTQRVEGDIGDAFNLADYEGKYVPNNYKFDHADNNSINSFTSSNQTVNMYVHENDTVTINYVDKGGQNNGQIVASHTYSNNPGFNGGQVPSDQFDRVPSGYKIATPSSKYVGPAGLINGATYTVPVTSTGDHPGSNVPTKNEGEIDVYFVNRNTDGGNPMAHLHDKSSSEIATYGNDSDGNQQSFSANPYINNFESAGGTNAKVWAGSAGIYEYLPEKQNVIIEFDKAPTATITNDIVYEDVNQKKDDGTYKQVGNPITISGNYNDPINYDQYEHFTPEGYTYDGQLLDHSNNFVTDGQKDIILVKKDVPDVTYGYINVKYVWGHGVAGHTQGSSAGNSDLTFAPYKSTFNAADSITNVPDGTTFQDVVGGMGNAPVYYPNNSYDSPYQLTVEVTPSKPRLTHYTIHYVDQSGNTIGRDTHITGKTGDPFDFSSFEYDVPGNGKYGFDKDANGALPSTYDGSVNKTITIHLKSNN